MTQRMVTADTAALVLIDVQPFFIPLMAGPVEPVMARIAHLLMLVRHYDIPVVATFEHPVESNGWLPPDLEELFPLSGQRFVKHTFNLTLEPEILRAVEQLGRTQIVVAGAETDVCVLQSTLGLLELGYQVFLAEDCIFTSEPFDGPAIRRMEQAGAIPTTYKALHYELRRSVDVPSLTKGWNEQFPGNTPRFVWPEALPPFRQSPERGNG